MTDRLLALFADILAVDPDSVTDATAPDNNPKWDSLANMILLSEIEETYAVELESDEITSMKSIGKIRHILANRGIDAA